MAGYRIPGPLCSTTSEDIDEGTTCQMRSPLPGPLTMLTPYSSRRDYCLLGMTSPSSTTEKTKSGKYWVTWADENAKNSTNIIDLDASFKANVNEFFKALTDAGASLDVSTTQRSAKRAYLFHWCWKIYLGKCKPSDATKMQDVDIEWDHGDLKKSKAGAHEMVAGFGLAVPPKSILAPSLTSNHIEGKAIDVDITWTGQIKVKKKDNTEVSVTYMANANANTVLHSIGASYSVIKLKNDAPHWSFDGL